MATQPPQSQPRQQQLARLFIPPSLNAQQPMMFSTPHDNGSLFSPALPTSIQQGMHPAYPLPFVPVHQHPQGPHGHPMQTPMQASFFPHQPPPAPGRPSMHRSHPSVAQLAAAGILPPPGMPMTPLGQGFPMNPQMLGVGAFPPPFVPRSKRASSVSVGGPPKAVLGGPQRKVSPIAPGAGGGATATAAASASGAAQAPGTKKPKKIIVKLPQETIKPEDVASAEAPATMAEDGTEASAEVSAKLEAGSRPSWARVPLLPNEVPQFPEVRYPEIRSAEPYYSDGWRYGLPNTVDVFLPGKVSGDRSSASMLLSSFFRVHGIQLNVKLLRKN